MRQVTEFRGRVLLAADASALRLEVSDNLRQRGEQARLHRRVARLPDLPERHSVARAMLAVEDRIVKAMWVIARQPSKRLTPDMLNKCGLDYLYDRSDIHSIYADAAGGQWTAIAPRPTIPNAREIDAADEAMEWLLHLDEGMRKILIAGATSKRGDTGRHVNWIRVRQLLKEHDSTPARTLKWRYRESLRIIVNALTEKRVAHIAQMGYQ